MSAGASGLRSLDACRIRRHRDRFARIFKRRNEIVFLQLKPGSVEGLGFLVDGDGTIRHVASAIDFQQAFFPEAFEQVSKAQHHYLVRNKEYPLTAVIEPEVLQNATQPERYIAPAFAAGRPIIKFAQIGTTTRLLREMQSNAGFREPINSPNSFSRSRSSTKHSMFAALSSRAMFSVVWSART